MATGSGEGVSVVVPFYNEEPVLARSARAVERVLRSRGAPFEVVLADDGSTDAGPRIAEDLSRRDPAVFTLVRNPRNAGKGAALMRGFRSARHDLLAFIDADLEISAEYLAPLIGELEAGAADVVVGEKSPTQGLEPRAIHRHAGSLVYNRLVRAIAGSRLPDHQCGLKGFHRRVLDAVGGDISEDGWAWDTELLVLAQARGFSVTGIPVRLERRRPSTVPFLGASLSMLSALLRLRARGYRA